MREIDEIILHCSATPHTQDIGAAEIRRWHTMPEPNGRGWSHIGYHYVIRRSGQVEACLPLEMPGIHCSGHNARSVGICLVGGGLYGEDPYFADEQFESLAGVIRELRQRWPLASIHGHNEYAQKACPVYSVPGFLEMYGFARDPWPRARWPHFRPSEFTSSGCPDLWGGGPMPGAWAGALDALEKLRKEAGRPLILARTEWKPSVPSLSCGIRTEDARAFTDAAMRAGFDSALASGGMVTLYKVGQA